MSSATSEQRYRLSPALRSPAYWGTPLPVQKYTRPSSGSAAPTSHIAPPPIFQESLSFGHVSCPGAAGPGTANHSHALRPVLASTATTFPRNPGSADVPTNIRPRAYTGAPHPP